ncbi:MAG: hypothetical protein CMQ21_16020 [Gammaproteobacteria bacterium]|jgi:hypothetical protein|nr:hypothetical protein [Gammaproteobacteria bacterium]|tara:strand:- start:708 stop:950 length:243 start_codon:yes stop_codon:yes gene_type:complete
MLLFLKEFIIFNFWHRSCDKQDAKKSATKKQALSNNNNKSKNNKKNNWLAEWEKFAFPIFIFWLWLIPVWHLIAPSPYVC